MIQHVIAWAGPAIVVALLNGVGAAAVASTVCGLAASIVLAANEEWRRLPWAILWLIVSVGIAAVSLSLTGTNR